jgi:hypothetical protein
MRGREECVFTKTNHEVRPGRGRSGEARRKIAWVSRVVGLVREAPEVLFLSQSSKFVEQKSPMLRGNKRNKKRGQNMCRERSSKRR